MSEQFDINQKTHILQIKYAIVNYTSDRLKQLDVRIQMLVKMYGILTGGVTASIFWGQKPNDFDIYFKIDHARDEFQKLMLDEKIQADIADVNPNYGVETLVNGKLVTSHAVTFKNGIQIVLMHTSEARETFDYIHTMPWYDFDTKKYHISRHQYDVINQKKLVKNPHPKSFGITEKRMQKFIDRGWTI